MFDTRLHKKLDIPLIVLSYAIAVVGVVMIYSATHGDATPYHKRQVIWIVLGSCALAGFAASDFHLVPRFARAIYIVNIACLGLVLKIGHSANGAVRWIRIAGFPFQPSEFAKLFVILTLAVFLVRRLETIQEPGTLLLSLLYIAAPMLLILKQPDLGTSLVVLAIWFGMTFIAGARVKHLAAIVLTGLTLFSVLWVTGIYPRPYQRNRLIAFIDPEQHANDSGYHVLQARIAIGSGEMWGKGLLRGTLVHGGYIPEKQTDFIFTDVGEELGFAGALCVTTLYALMLYRGVLIIAAADEDMLGKLIAAGVVTMLAFHVVVNMGMNVGVMPVAGVPLPLISAGGSNVILTLASVGLLQSVALHRHQLLF